MMQFILAIDVRTSLFSSFDKVKLTIFAMFCPSVFCPRMVMLDHKKQMSDLL